MSSHADKPAHARRRTVFFVSDQTGVTAETVGHSVLAQFAGLEVREVTLPFVSSRDKALEAVRRIDRAAAEEGVRPIVFSTLVEDDLRAVVRQCNALFLDCFGGLVVPLEHELERRSAHRTGRSHPVADPAYTLRIDATNYALANDDGGGGDYARADVILVGVSRSGKTPTCLYMALQYGVFAANYPLTEDELESRALPHALAAHRRKLYGLTIQPERLRQIREERRPQSPYASAQQVQYELRAAEALFARYGITVLDTTDSSIEEIASRILNEAGVERACGRDQVRRRAAVARPTLIARRRGAAASCPAPRARRPAPQRHRRPRLPHGPKARRGDRRARRMRPHSPHHGTSARSFPDLGTCIPDF